MLIRLQDPAEMTENNDCQPNAISDYSHEAEPVARAPLQPEGNVQKLSEQEIQAKLKEEMGVSWVKEKLILLLECLLCL